MHLDRLPVLVCCLGCRVLRGVAQRLPKGDEEFSPPPHMDTMFPTAAFSASLRSALEMAINAFDVGNACSI